jgi:mRNA-degrading endonuclease RelE of RelBE toxin-antitoxin system
MKLFTFTETERFTRKAIKLIGEDGIAEIQSYLCRYPDDGAVIPETLGLRKLRWAVLGHGKKGGARVIYYFAISRDRILLLDIYAKNEKADISKRELKDLDFAAREWLKLYDK